MWLLPGSTGVVIMSPVFAVVAFVLTGLKLASAVAQPHALLPSLEIENALSAKIDTACRASCDHLVNHLGGDFSSGVHSFSPEMDVRHAGNIIIVKGWDPCSRNYPKTKAYIDKALSGNGDIRINCSLPEGVQVIITHDRPDGIGFGLIGRGGQDIIGIFIVGTESFYRSAESHGLSSPQLKTSGYITKNFGSGSASARSSGPATPRSVLANGASLAQAIVPVSAVLFLAFHVLC